MTNKTEIARVPHELTNARDALERIVEHRRTAGVLQRPEPSKVIGAMRRFTKEFCRVPEAELELRRRARFVELNCQPGSRLAQLVRQADQEGSLREPLPPGLHPVFQESTELEFSFILQRILENVRVSLDERPQATPAVEELRRELIRISDDAVRLHADGCYFLASVMDAESETNSAAGHGIAAKSILNDQGLEFWSDEIIAAAAALMSWWQTPAEDRAKRFDILDQAQQVIRLDESLDDMKGVAEPLQAAPEPTHREESRGDSPQAHNKRRNRKTGRKLQPATRRGNEVAKRGRRKSPPKALPALRDEANGSGAEPTFTLLSRYPASPAGHVAFLEFVRDEIGDAAEAKRLRVEKGYPNATLESMVRGIKWKEAQARADVLRETLPKAVVDAVRQVLSRELSVGTVEDLNERLQPVIRHLRDAWEHSQGLSRGESFAPPALVEKLLAGSDDAELSPRDMAMLEAYLANLSQRPQTAVGVLPVDVAKLTLIRDFNRNLQAANSPSSSVSDVPLMKSMDANVGTAPKPSRKRGRKKADFAAAQREAEIAKDWERARESGLPKVDFANGKGMQVKALNQLLDRVRKRKAARNN